MKGFFYIDLIGCARMKSDVFRITCFMKKNGYKRTFFPRKAKYIIVGTCGVSEEIENECIKLIKKMGKKERKLLIVYGCLPGMNPERILGVAKSIMIPSQEIARFDEIIEGIEESITRISDLNISTLVDLFWDRFKKLVSMVRGRSKRYKIETKFNTFKIKIATGCYGNCSFCNIKKANGPLKSKSMELILKELSRNSHRARNVDIISSDSGAYGLDINTNFPSLLNQILGADSAIKIHFIQDIAPRWILLYEKELLEIISRGRIQKIMIPIQSGSSRILKMMNRNSNIDHLMEVIRRFRAIDPKLLIRTQIIVGFPSENMDDFKLTLSVLENFDEIDAFQYYENQYTDSREFHPKVGSIEIQKRFATLKKDFGRILHIYY